MSGNDDTRLEHVIGEALRRRDPGPAPLGLRERVARVPETAPAGSPLVRRISRAVVPVLGLAAAIVLLLITVPLLAPPGSGPGASTAPVTTFDPSLRGPGLVPPPAFEAEALVPLGLLLVGVLVFAIAPRGPRRAIATLAVLVVLGVGGALVLLTHASTGPIASSGGIGVLNVEQTQPSNPYPVYINAGPGGPFSFGFSVENAGPLTIRIDGIEDPAVDPAAYIPTFHAAWLDREQGGGVGGPAEPFTPTDVAPGEFVTLWVVGTASTCAAGPAFNPGGSWSAIHIPDVRVRYTILGIPRTTTVRLPFDLMQPYEANCPPAQP